jgi:hypothetical protein
MTGGVGRLDLEQLRIERLELTCPASDVDMTLPAGAGQMAVQIRAKAALIVVRIPDGVAARIRAPGAGAVAVDLARFPPHAESEFRSPDFGTATDRIDIRADLPGGALRIDAADGMGETIRTP